MNRRSLMKAIGLAPAAAASVSPATIMAITDADKETELGSGWDTGMTVPYMDSGQKATFSSWSEAWRHVLNDPDMALDELLTEVDAQPSGRIAHLLPPDLAAKRSWSMSVKVREAQLRAARRAIERRKADSSGAREMVERLMGYRS